MMPPPPDDTRTLIDELLAEQQRLTVVGRFARQHEFSPGPAQERYYHDLIPLTQPQPGQQYAFEVDLDKCSGCKACVSACHNLNGLDDGESWRGVGLLFSDDWRQPFQQTVTTACHHCVDPGCLNGCPVLAYDKDPVTGIVRHLDDQCIGCQYCVMKCPYDVPKYSAQRGIVRKCDMCANRLAVGEAPACVQACPTEAIRITMVETKVVQTGYRRGAVGFNEVLSDNEFLPGSPAPGITLPTTRYKSKKPLPAGLIPADHACVTPSDPHLPLVFMLVLTQLSVGVSVMAIFFQPAKWPALISLATGALALGLASLHLGRPLKAWRAFLGWRKSWFSREVIFFGGFVPLSACSTAMFWFAPDASFHGVPALFAAMTGLLGVVCSAMVYVDTHREFWRASQCFGKFLGTTVLLGAATMLAISPSTTPALNTGTAILAILLSVATIMKLGLEQQIFRHLADKDALRLTSLNKSARLMAGELGPAARVRVACGVMGGVVLPALLLVIHARSSTPDFRLTPLALVLCLAGELLERYLFFTAVAPTGMPGGVAS